MTPYHAVHDELNMTRHGIRTDGNKMLMVGPRAAC